MTLIEAIVLGAVQGVTEFLPVSSTAHLVLVPWFLGWDDPGLSFDVALHLGTLVALLLYFRQEWIYLAKSGVGYLQGRVTDPLLLYIIVGTIPAGLAGALLESYVENKLRDPRIISVTLILLAFLLIAAEIKGRKKKDMEQMTWSDAILIGCSQAIALIPGVSRSGITITTALFRGFRRETAAQFSFFLSTPIIGGAVAKKLFEIARHGVPAGEGIYFVVGIVTAGLVGYASIKYLLEYLQFHNAFIFAYYRIFLGIVVYLAFASGFR